MLREEVAALRGELMRAREKLERELEQRHKLQHKSLTTRKDT